MEPTFESKPSAEFDKSHHHIFKAEDVVFVLEDYEKEVDPNGRYGEYIRWINRVLTDTQGFSFKELHQDAKQIEQMVKWSQSSDFDIYQTVNPQLAESARQLREAYDTMVNGTVTELNTFIQQNSGLLLWSDDAEDTIDEITVLTDQEGFHRPDITSNKLYVNVDRLNEDYRTLVMTSLSDV